MPFLDELDIHRYNRDETAGGKIERVKGLLASKYNDEVDAFVWQQSMVFANNINLWLDSSICGADSNTRHLKECLREGVAFSPFSQGGDKYRGLLDLRQNKKFENVFRAMMLFQALSSIQPLLNNEVYAAFKSDCLDQYSNNHIFTLHIHGKGWQPNPASGVLEEFESMYNSRREEFNADYLLALTFLDLYFYSPPYAAQAEIDRRIIFELSFECEGYIEWAGSLAKQAAPEVSNWYQLKPSDSDIKDPAPKIKRWYQL